MSPTFGAQVLNAFLHSAHVDKEGVLLHGLPPVVLRPPAAVIINGVAGADEWYHHQPRVNNVTKLLQRLFAPAEILKIQRNRTRLIAN
jgi:hypothetical protein